ncbi:hypothetical protein CO051_03100 [Candidatus Roizmanbacteria bacterium CG_4_9_14_0_2_um_filter_39_13]|uniref:histidine kinase n=1 Tax=Candidatus Roizmanbacteria bacterium CG_4_9_14_0_2_um_filter_39_13 TaxID=1974839 RepID=A0A2M8EZR6_9BACT|nr:MAG: hypothetical protein COY15_03185 [Candidatus Roizmanbacteria bacterium CG_4_10_14_0_2_um_filter_39_12]PJC32525.1 MAG: hypothetical protein CO051_03100 [Candidatus Roizmanbacteria bacterium CG_4_9_14_0_2_um_filter_39_13]
MFHNARIKLTFWYLLIIMTVSVAFSAVILSFTTREAHRFALEQRRSIQQRLENDEFFFKNRPRAMVHIIEIEDDELIKEVQSRTLFSLSIVNGIILVVAGGLGYVLAGKTLRPIKEMVDEQNRFISDASHELKTPLTSLKTTFEVFLRGKHQKIHEAQTLIQESILDVNKLQHLSESLLSLAQFQAPNGRKAFAQVKIKNTIVSAIKQVKILAESKKIVFHKNLAGLSTLADQYRLEEVWLILLDNAIKYSPEKSTITISLQKSRACAEIRIEDQGIGISKNDVAHIFDRFYRADSARCNQKNNGFGLGLAIAKKIVEDHHGTIHVEPAEKNGSTFIVKLPLK